MLETVKEQPSMMRFEYGRFTTPHTVGELRRIFDQLSPQMHAIITKRAAEYSGIQQIVDALRDEDRTPLARHVIVEINALLAMVEREEKMDDEERSLSTRGERVAQQRAVSTRSFRNLFGLLSATEPVAQ
jgi:hypothetical protein